jgi:hypothetical protein
MKQTASQGRAIAFFTVLLLVLRLKGFIYLPKRKV